MDKTQALQNLLDGTASEEDITLLKGLLASGDIWIGGDVNHSVIITGSGNTFSLSPAARDMIGANSWLGDLDRELTGDEIAQGLQRLENELPRRAPILLSQFQEQSRRLKPLLKTNAVSLGEQAQRERLESLAYINSLSMEALDISFNALCLGEEPPDYDERCPFRGMGSFRVEDHEFFFGREELTQKLVRKIQSHPFLAVLGASGSGKSSIVMAGMIPALDLDYAVIRPGMNPLDTLESARGKPLIVVDQFEELFTLTRDESVHREFITRLLGVEKHSRIVITLRSDFLGEVARYRELNEEIQAHLENVPPMNMEELRRAMEGQAGVVGLRFEADLSQQILDDVEGERGAMPLLQHALWELWSRRHGRNLRTSEYRAFGGVRQAITNTAEKIYGECNKEEQDLIREILLRLTRLDDSNGKRDTRRRVARSELISLAADPTVVIRLIDKLESARLISSLPEQDQPEIEVAHEALIRYWKRLNDWLSEDRNILHMREDVTDAAHQWKLNGQDESYLVHKKARLRSAVELSLSLGFKLTELEQNYLNLCDEYEKKEKKKKARLLALMSVLILGLLVLAGVLLEPYTSREQALPGLWITVPSGTFVMGMDEKEAEMYHSRCESLGIKNCTEPNGLIAWQGKVDNANLGEYSIMENEVTNAQYRQCANKNACKPPVGWSYNPDEVNKPATGLTWYKAMEYCSWLDGSLPTEAEWEKAARGPEGNYFPWGDEWDMSRANLLYGGPGKTQTIDLFSQSDVSYYRVRNLAGNVREWTSSGCEHPLCSQFMGQAFASTPLLPSDAPDKQIVIRGGSWWYEYSLGIVSIRSLNAPDNPLSDIGFRCACPDGHICKEPWTSWWIWFGDY